MRFWQAVLVLLMVAPGARAQNHEPHGAAIARAQQLLVSEIDGRLPRVTLRFFLDYEATGATVEWSVVDCGTQATPGRVCVQAAAELDNRRAFSVLVAVAKTSAHVLSATVTDANGAPRPVRLFELPAAAHSGDWPRRRPILPEYYPA